MAIDHSTLEPFTNTYKLENVCELCQRHMTQLTKHHLIPQTRHKNKKNKRNFDRKEVKERVAWLCGPCHRHIHNTISNKELEYQYNTIPLLLAHPDIEKFVQWIKKRPADTSIPMQKRNNYF